MFAKHTILQALARRKSFLFSISVMVMLSMGNHALAAVLCPHMSGREEACVSAAIKRHSQAKARDVATPAANESPDAGHCHRGAAAKLASDSQATPSAESSHETVAANPVDHMPEDRRPSQAVTRTDGDCAHCMMHSQADPAGWSRVVVQSSGSHETASADSTSASVKPALAKFSFLDIHDHGPPGASNARYLLLNTFRI